MVRPPLLLPGLPQPGGGGDLNDQPDGLNINADGLKRFAKGSVGKQG